jgi:hypothetical protein
MISSLKEPDGIALVIIRDSYPVASGVHSTMRLNSALYVL